MITIKTVVGHMKELILSQKFVSTLLNIWKNDKPNILNMFDLSFLSVDIFQSFSLSLAFLSLTALS